jgi:hypothetical protein
VALFRSSVAAAVLGALFSAISFGDVLHAVGSAAPAPLIGAVGLSLGAQFSGAVRLRPMLAAQGIAAARFELFQINLATLFYGLFLPAGNLAGIAIRFYKMASRHGKYAGIAFTLLLDRLLATLALCFVGVAFWLLERPSGTWPVAAAMAAAFFLLLILPALLLLGSRLPARMPDKLAGVRQAVRLAACLPAGTLGRIGWLAVLAQLLGIGAYALVAQAIGIDLSGVTIAWTRSAAMLLAILPVSVAGLGIREGALLLLLAPYGVPAAEAMAFSLIAFASSTLAAGLLGGLFEARRLLCGEPAGAPAEERPRPGPEAGSKAHDTAM